MNCGPCDFLEAKIHLLKWMEWKWSRGWSGGSFSFFSLLVLGELYVWRAIIDCTWQVLQWNFIRLLIFFLWFWKLITHLIWSFYVKVILEKVRDRWLLKKMGAEFSRAYNYLMKRILLLGFQVFIYWDVSFFKSYHSLNLELVWKCYELRSEVVRSCPWFE